MSKQILQLERAVQLVLVLGRIVIRLAVMFHHPDGVGFSDCRNRTDLSRQSRVGKDPEQPTSKAKQPDRISVRKARNCRLTYLVLVRILLKHLSIVAV